MCRCEEGAEIGADRWPCNCTPQDVEDWEGERWAQALESRKAREEEEASKMRGARKILAIAVAAVLALACTLVVMVVRPCSLFAYYGQRLLDQVEGFSKALGEWAYHGRWPDK